MKPQSDKPEQHWKEKYLALLDADSARQAQREEREQLLSRAVVRLTFAASGLDPALDPHLQAIREVVRKESQTTRLREQLDALTDALVRIPAADSADDAQLSARELLRYLQAQFPGPEQRPQLSALQQRIEHGGFGSREQVFGAVAKFLQGAGSAAASVRPGMLGRLLAKGPRSAGRADEAIVLRHLEALLAALSVPQRLQRQMEQLLGKVRHGDGDLVPLLDSSATLITEISAEIQREQQELRSFLAELSGKLEEVEGRALGLDSLNEQSAANRRQNDQVLGSALVSLRATACDATDLQQLKEALSSRLDQFATQMEAFRDAEENRYRESQRQLREMGQRVRNLEQEADDLRSKLEFAHDHAFTDPLTGLPNATAYAERAVLEEKRWQRFRQAVSLAVWDIDDFRAITERFGRTAGEKLLGFVGRILVGAVRGSDFVGRYGGEKFVMLLVGTDETSALEVAQEVRRRIESCEFTTSGKPVPVTISCGISEFKGRDGAGDVFERADLALQQARRKGRNRCELAPARL